MYTYRIAEGAGVKGVPDRKATGAQHGCTPTDLPNQPVQ
jgi:hypothetical protein